MCSKTDREGLIKIFKGSFVAIVTPFKTEGGKLVIDWETLAKLIYWQIANGTDGIVVGGCTGESFTLTHDEQKALISFVFCEAKGRIKVIAGTGSNSTAEATSLTQHAATVGVDAAMVITPYANKPTQEGLFNHYRRIASNAAIPIMLYNVPGRTGVNLLPETVARLVQSVDTIVAIKEASGFVNQTSEVLDRCNIAVLSGDDPLTLPLMAVGAQGVVSVTANIAPGLVSQCVHTFLRGDLAKAQAFHRQLYPVHQAMFLETNPGPVKAAMQMLELLPNASCREPLAPMQPSARNRLRQVLADAQITYVK